jgi:hypothetical protein
MTPPPTTGLQHALRFLGAVLIAALCACATPVREPEPPPEPPVADVTWRLVERDIGAASDSASGMAGRYARDRMEAWKRLVLARNEADFIPWFSSYWTQQWLTIKVAWYKLASGENEDPAVTRLAAYLQAQYQERVLAPVAKSIDPVAVRAQATRHYVRNLAEQLAPIPLRHGIPETQFARRLQAIPAIAMAPPPAHDASLHRLILASPIDDLPAYAALRQQVARAAGETGSGPSASHVSPVARRASERLMARLAISGGTSAASALAGGIAGTVISLGAAGIGLVLHESERGDLEAQLRESLNAGLEEMWQSLVDDPARGVMAEVYHIAEQIEKCCPQTFAQPVEAGEALEESALPELQTGPAAEMVEEPADDEVDEEE